MNVDDPYAEIIRLRNVMLRWGKVLVAKGLATPNDVAEGFRGCWHLSVSPAYFIELDHLYEPFKKGSLIGSSTGSGRHRGQA